MTNSSLDRMGGLALMAGGLFGITALLLEPTDIALTQKASGRLFELDIILGAIASLLILIALPMVYAHQVRHMGALGLVGFIGLLCTVTFCGVVRYTVLGLVLPWLTDLGVNQVQMDTVPVVLTAPFIAAGFI